MKNANKAVIYVAKRFPAVVAEFRNHGNPVIQRGGDAMHDIAGIADQCTGRHQQEAERALFWLPMAQIERCIALYEAVR